ncbi:hypothetical protein HDV00_004616 [Rhizophlyctis rosea]|nr:hypothetical protein HDV00_004616 [Rhizophlyctis rosea]
MKLTQSIPSFLILILALSSLSTPIQASPKGGGGGGKGGGGGGGSKGGSSSSSSGGTKGGSTSSGGGSSSGSRSTTPFKGTSRGTAGRSIPYVPYWGTTTNHYRGVSNVGRIYRKLIGASFLAFWLGYVIADNAIDNDVLDTYWQRCDECRYIREGVYNCANVQVPYANGTGQSLPQNITSTSSLEIDQECLCPKLNYDVFDKCFSCESRIPSSVQSATRDLRDTCDDFLQDYLTSSGSGGPPIAGIAMMGIAGLVSALYLWL